MVSHTLSLTLQDLRKEEQTLLFSPSNPTPVETMFLSNIDQALTFPVETVFFYEVPSNMTLSDTTDVADKVKKAVSEVLLRPYYFMAGRLNFNDDTKRMELICNNAGVIFVNAKSRFSIKDLGNLSYPNPTFSNLIHRPGLYKSLAETAVFTIQVTKFKCGGFSIGFMSNHAILDGKSASEMLDNLASVCRGEGLKSQPIKNDRTCIRARNPPQIHYPHKEYVELAKTASLASSFTSQKRTSPSPLIFSEKYAHKLFSFSFETLKLLKQKAILKCSTFEAIAAHIWRARTKAVFDEKNHDQDSTVLFAVDIRNETTPPLPDSFAGNAVITAFATAKARDLIEKPLSFGVETVKKGRERVTDKYIRSAIDWLEVHKGIPATCDGSFYVSAWWKLPFKELDFGFGKPRHGGPIVSGNDEFVLLLSDENGIGINVWMGLEKEKMERFKSCVFEI
ncbi:acyltransferase GLAUCE-like [Primulina huaijiensis]|uniref:acyltransferase GLAUCE-like n=1 Tax=Primulina huaijiensis TaxID=1492673 RepID=UPI003CC7807B